MRYYFAPMEGLTDGIYRRLHHTYFPGVTRYYTPFFSPTVHRNLTPKERKELTPEPGIPVVPQILTKNAEDFLWLADRCGELGYEEVNLNLGCPSGTVTAKGKGSGLLLEPDVLDSFLYDIFKYSPIPVSVKTRLGFHSPEEFPRLLEVFNRYPIKELTVHPRVRNDFYKGSVRMDWFRYAVENTTIPLCYNGNLNTLSDIHAIEKAFPSVEAVMLGRGLIGDPGMITEGGTTADTLEAFHNALLEGYADAFGNTRNAMFRMKENWCYFIRHFSGSEKLFKRLRKTTDIEEYRSITAEIFHTLPLLPTLNADW